MYKQLKKTLDAILNKESDYSPIEKIVQIIIIFTRIDFSIPVADIKDNDLIKIYEAKSKLEEEYILANAECNIITPASLDLLRTKYDSNKEMFQKARQGDLDAQTAILDLPEKLATSMAIPHTMALIRIAIEDSSFQPNLNNHNKDLTETVKKKQSSICDQLGSLYKVYDDTLQTKYFFRQAIYAEDKERIAKEIRCADLTYKIKQFKNNEDKVDSIKNELNNLFEEFTKPTQTIENSKLLFEFIRIKENWQFIVDYSAFYLYETIDDFRRYLSQSVPKDQAGSTYLSLNLLYLDLECDENLNNFLSEANKADMDKFSKETGMPYVVYDRLKYFIYQALYEEENGNKENERAILQEIADGLGKKIVNLCLPDEEKLVPHVISRIEQLENNINTKIPSSQAQLSKNKELYALKNHELKLQKNDFSEIESLQNDLAHSAHQVSTQKDGIDYSWTVSDERIKRLMLLDICIAKLTLHHERTPSFLESLKMFHNYRSNFALTLNIGPHVDLNEAIRFENEWNKTVINARNGDLVEIQKIIETASHILEKKNLVISYKEATHLEYFLNALIICEENKNKISMPLVKNILYVLGKYYLYNINFNQAIFYFQWAESLKEPHAVHQLKLIEMALTIKEYQMQDIKVEAAIIDFINEAMRVNQPDTFDIFLYANTLSLSSDINIIIEYLKKIPSESNIKPSAERWLALHAAENKLAALEVTCEKKALLKLRQKNIRNAMANAKIIADENTSIPMIQITYIELCLKAAKFSIGDEKRSYLQDAKDRHQKLSREQIPCSKNLSNEIKNIEIQSKKYNIKKENISQAIVSNNKDESQSSQYEKKNLPEAAASQEKPKENKEEATQELLLVNGEIVIDQTTKFNTQAQKTLGIENITELLLDMGRGLRETPNLWKVLTEKTIIALLKQFAEKIAESRSSTPRAILEDNRDSILQWADVIDKEIEKPIPYDTLSVKETGDILLTIGICASLNHDFFDNFNKKEMLIALLKQLDKASTPSQSATPTTSSLSYGYMWQSGQKANQPLGEDRKVNDERKLTTILH